MIGDLCSRCQIEQITRRRTSMCNECHKKYMRQHYLDNTDVYKAKAKRIRDKLFAERTVLIYEYLLKHPCIDCGETDPVVLEFDHVKGKKAGNISMMLKNSSLEELLAEMKKCEVRCSNCHKKITAKRGNFWKYKMNMSRSFNR